MNAEQICNHINSSAWKPEGVTVVCRFINGTEITLRGAHNSKKRTKRQTAWDVLFGKFTFQQTIDYINNVWLDRTLSGNVGFHPAFPNVVHVPLKSATGPVKFRIFVDQCSIEVFVNDGERVLSSLILPDVADRGLELFSSFNSSTLLNLKAWQLATIWPQ